MVVLVLGMLTCVATGGVVLGYVAREARREEREFWTPEGERLIADARRRGDELRQRSDELRYRVGAGAERVRPSRLTSPRHGAHVDEAEGHRAV